MLMSTQKIAANKATTAKSQLGDILNHVEVPTQINGREKHLYHVLMVDAKFDQSSLTTKYSSKVQIFNKESWRTVKKNLKQIGVTHAYVIHDPTQGEGDAKAKEETKPTGGDSKPKNEPKKDKNDAQTKRNALIEEAKALGYEGALNVKNAIFEEFIKNAKENGESEENGGEA